MACVICGSNNKHFLTDKERHNYKHKIYICRNCGLIYTYPQPNSSELDFFYKHIYRSSYAPIWNKDRFFNHQKKRGAAILRFMALFLDLRKHKTVLEIGCSYGGILKAFKLYGFKVTGVEKDAAAVKYATRKGIKVKATAPNKKHDVYILSHVLEHFSNPESLLRNMRKRLSDDDLVYLEVPNAKMYQSFKLYFQYPHLFHFTPVTLRNLLSKTGYRIIKGKGCKLVLKKGQIKNTFKSDYKSFLELWRKNNKKNYFYQELKYYFLHLAVKLISYIS